MPRPSAKETDFELVRESPPRLAKGSSEQLERNLREAQKHPGQSFRVAAYPARSTALTTARELRQGKPSRGVPAGEWDIRTAKMADGRTGIWATFIGPPRDSPSRRLGTAPATPRQRHGRQDS